MVGRKMLVMIISYTGTPCSASPLPQPGIQRQGTSLPETPDGKDHPQSKLGPHWATHSWGASRGSLAWAGSQLHLPPPGTQTSAPAPWHLEEGWDTSRPPSQPERAPCSRCPTARSNGSPGVALAAGETDTVTTCELAWPIQRGVGESSWCLGLPAPLRPVCTAEVLGDPAWPQPWLYWCILSSAPFSAEELMSCFRTSTNLFNLASFLPQIICLPNPSWPSWLWPLTAVSPQPTLN